jgi:large subunit ribosomal protein L30
MQRIRITQIKSTIKKPKDQKLTMQALKLGKINKTVEFNLTPAIAGMVRKVQHLVTTEIV